MRTVVFAAVPLASLIACSHAQPAPVATPVAAPAAPVQVFAEPAPAPQPVTAPAQPQLTTLGVYFDYDSAELLPETRAALQAFFDQARQQPDRRIRIEGNCDERGTREYNLALGQRRADAARKYLVDLGFPADQITTISYGKERPSALGHDEEAWKQNRRDDLVPRDSTASDAVSQASR